MQLQTLMSIFEGGNFNDDDVREFHGVIARRLRDRSLSHVVADELRARVAEIIVEKQNLQLKNDIL